MFFSLNQGEKSWVCCLKLLLSPFPSAGRKSNPIEKRKGKRRRKRKRKKRARKKKKIGVIHSMCEGMGVFEVLIHQLKRTEQQNKPNSCSWRRHSLPQIPQGHLRVICVFCLLFGCLFVVGSTLVENGLIPKEETGLVGKKKEKVVLWVGRLVKTKRVTPIFSTRHKKKSIICHFYNLLFLFQIDGQIFV